MTALACVFVYSQNSQVEILSPKVLVWEAELLGGDWVVRVDPF